MKKIIRITTIYTLLMLAVLVLIILLVNHQEMKMGIPASYSNEEIEIYKKIWGSLKGGSDSYRHQLLVCVISLWAVVLVSGYILITVIVFTEIRPILELQKYAEEIAKGNLDTALPLSSSNQFVGFAESFDIMREELIKSKEREIEAESAKREMVAELSHDLKTPIATIQATCEVMNLQLDKKLKLLEEEKKQTESSDSENREQLETSIRETENNLEKIGYISNKADTINELVQNVFRATIEDMEEIEVAVEEYESTLIEGYFKNLTEYGNIILENSIPESLVYIDKLRMEQVIDNIVGNSHKYAGTDIHVRFDEESVASDDPKKLDRYIRITIRDAGPGVARDELPLIVEKFYRGKASKEKNGYGLGLYLAKTYMERQGGGMEYYNDNGFVVVLMVKKV